MPSSTASSAEPPPGVRALAAGDWAGQVAGAWAGLLGRRPGLRMCLATGRTPLPVYATLRRALVDRVGLRPGGYRRSSPPPPTWRPSAGRSTPGWTRAWPVWVASLLQGHPGCTWWLDAAAASRLTGRAGAAQTT